MTRHRVLMIGPHPPAVGGVANVLDLLCRSSLKDRFELVPFSTTKRRKHVFPNRPHWDSGPYLVWHLLSLVWVLLTQRPRVVYLKATSDTGFLRDTALMAASKLFGKPVLCHLHGRPRGRLFGGGNSFPARVTRWGMGLADTVIVLSPGLARQFGEMFPAARLVVVPNVVEVDRFHPREGERRPGPPRVLAVGRLSREKGVWDLLEVAARLKTQGKPAQFILCGLAETPEEDRAVRDRARELQVEDCVDFRGVVRGDALAATHRGAGGAGFRASRSHHGRAGHSRDVHRAGSRTPGAARGSGCARGGPVPLSGRCRPSGTHRRRRPGPGRARLRGGSGGKTGGRIDGRIGRLGGISGFTTRYDLSLTRHQ